MGSWQLTSISYGYDAASNRTSFTDPENGSSSYVYDTLNRLQTLTPPTAISSGSFGFGYDALSRRTSLTRPNTVNISYGYDTLSRLLSVTHAKGGATLDGATYTVDNAGNRTAKSDLYAGVTTSYGYDNIYELLSATQGGSTTESYTYDPVGNRLTALGSATWTYNTSNELNSRPGAAYAFDANGNTIVKTDGTGSTSYTWDFENRLTSVILPGSGGTVSFLYDPFGRRIYKSSSSGTSIYAYDGDNLVEETNASGGVVARYSQGLNIDEPLAMLRTGATSFYQADGLGSVTSLTNTAGAAAQTYTYDSFGNILATTGSLVNSFQYTGREFDPETSLYYCRARYYDPGTGRFLREDPVRFADGHNFYSYVRNNPVNRKDPLGLWQVDIGGGIGLGAELTFGSNNGQWNFGLYTGYGFGFFGSLDPVDDPGCHYFGAHGGTRTEGGLGFLKYASLSTEITENPEYPGGLEGQVRGNVNLPGVSSTWNPANPEEAPHGQWGGGEGGFAGLGFHFYSPPNQSSECGCESN